MTVFGKKIVLAAFGFPRVAVSGMIDMNAVLTDVAHAGPRYLAGPHSCAYVTLVGKLQLIVVPTDAHAPLGLLHRQDSLLLALRVGLLAGAGLGFQSRTSCPLLPAASVR